MRKNFRWAMICLCGACEAGASTAPTQHRSSVGAAGAVVEQSPVLVELFTSQGCSSCPAADVVLRELVQHSQTEVIALAFHVDYWNYIGWKDPFSSRQWSARQRDYAQARNSNRVYTPQFLFDGTDHNVGANEGRAREAVADEAGKQSAALEVTAQEIGGRVAIEVSLGAAGPDTDASVFVASVREFASTKVRAGENNRRTLENAFIVLEMERACAYEPGATCTANLPMPEHAAHVVAWVQSPSTMEVHAARTAAIR